MDKKTKYWISAMKFCTKYCGCHQLPERSFFIKGYQFPLCARCTGIFIGYVIAIFLLILRIYIPVRFCIAFILLMGFDGGLQFFTQYVSNNLKRFITGCLYGAGLVHLLFNLILLLAPIK